ncbi:hypothetical protein Tco_0679469 [Tanacetum coccineum]|uniref:Uncharacterized protein n=1 Tax=Tanacetum coccineum TaxID=301880 RepID=A0ABQ4XHX3_9ASTR
MDLFNLISAPNPAKVKTGTRPRAAHKVPLLTITENRVIDMGEPNAATESSGTPSTIERSPLDFANENPSQPINEGDGMEDQVLETGASKVPPTGHASTTGVAPNIVIEEEDDADVPLVSKRRRKRVDDGANANAPPKADSTLSAPASQGTPTGTIDPNPLSFAEPQPAPARDIAESSKGATVARDPDSEKSSSFTSFDGSPGEVRLLKKAKEKVAKRDQRIHAREEEIKKLDQEVQGLRNQTSNLETLLEAEVDMKKVAEANSAELTRELESLRAKFANLQVNNNQLVQQVSTLHQVTGEEQIKAAFEEFKKREGDKVEWRCAEIDARLDALSIDFDEELYPHMLTAIAGHRWVIGQSNTLARNECAESTVLRQRIANVVSRWDCKGHEYMGWSMERPTLHALKDLKYPLIDHLEKLKDAPIDLIMASLHLESDVGEETPQWIRELRPSSSQLKIPVYPEVRDPRDPWAFKEEMLLEDAIMANVSRAEKKKKCRVVCRTHGIGSAHHPRSDGIPVSVPTVAPQGLAILLTDAATRTETTEDEASPRLIRSKSLPPMYNLDWP